MSPTVQLRGERFVSRISDYAAVRVDQRRTLVFGVKRPFIITAPAVTDVAGSASVLGNVLAARGDTPAVEVEASGDCLFNDNRCELRGNNDSAVRVTSGVTIVNANRVRGGKVSIELRGNPDRMTVLGNITTGGISTGISPLSAPWNALNLMIG